MSRIRCLMIWATASIPFLALTGCQDRNEFVPPPPPKVTVAQPVQIEVADSIQFTGTTRATAKVDIRPKVSGDLKEILFKDGSIVEKGTPLFQIDPARYEVEVTAARAALVKAESNLSLAKANKDRTEQLYNKNSTSKQEVEVKTAEFAVAEAEVESVKAALKKANLYAGYTTITAPITGRIGRHMVDAGNWVTAEQTVLASIETLDPIHAYFSISEPDLLRFMKMLSNRELPDPNRVTPKLFLGLTNEDGFPHEGELDYRELGVDPGTGTVLRRAVFPNPPSLAYQLTHAVTVSGMAVPGSTVLDLSHITTAFGLTELDVSTMPGANHRLIPGLFVRILAKVGDPKPRLLVEERALGTDQRGDYLLVVNDKKVVEYRKVELGIAHGGLRVIEKGIGPTDWVIINGLQRAQPGAQVDPERSKMGQE